MPGWARRAKDGEVRTEGRSLYKSESFEHLPVPRDVPQPRKLVL